MSGKEEGLVNDPARRAAVRMRPYRSLPYPSPLRGEGSYHGWGGILLKALARGAPDASIGLATGRCQ
jgi:hypothetical protein